jgi:hypothetical protein
MQLVTFTVSPSRSNSMLPYRYQQILGIFKGNMIAVSVSGVFPGFPEVSPRAPPDVHCRLSQSKAL